MSEFLDIMKDLRRSAKGFANLLEKAVELMEREAAGLLVLAEKLSEENIIGSIDWKDPELIHYIKNGKFPSVDTTDEEKNDAVSDELIIKHMNERMSNDSK